MIVSIQEIPVFQCRETVKISIKEKFEKGLNSGKNASETSSSSYFGTPWNSHKFTFKNLTMASKSDCFLH